MAADAEKRPVVGGEADLEAGVGCGGQDRIAILADANVAPAGYDETPPPGAFQSRSAAWIPIGSKIQTAREKEALREFITTSKG